MPVAVLVLTAVVALHVIDDCFLRPAAGTSAADHVVSGAVTLSGLSLAAWSTRRVRPGAAAATTAVLGLAGLVVGLDAAYSAVTVGPSWDDVSGMVALAAGVSLVALGTRGLWRSRRRGGSRARRYAGRLLRALAAVLALGAVAQPVAASYVATQVVRAEVPAPQLGRPHEAVSVVTSDGLRLAGWYVPARNGAAVLVFPGRGGTQEHARMLVRRGYGVLLLDRRGEGESEGAPHPYGWGGQHDVHAAVAFLEARPDVQPGRIGGLGLSVGGELLLHAAAESTGLAAVVSDGAGVRSILEGRTAMDTRSFWALAPVLAVEHLALRTFSDADVPPRLAGMVARIAPRPVLLIASTSSRNLEGVNSTYREAIGATASLWELEAGHVQGVHALPEEYERRVVGFLDRALLTPGAPATAG